MPTIAFKSLESVFETPLKEPSTPLELKLALNQVLGSELPGFVLRRTFYGAPIKDIPALASALSKTLAELGATFELRRINDTLRRQQGPGNLHRDAVRIAGPVSALILHQTTSGSGRVIIANSGELVPGKGMGEEKAWEYNEKVDDVVGEKLLLAGIVDPGYMQPELYTAELNSGDFTVFAMFNTHGPVWHRFDTSSDERTAATDDFIRIEPA